MALFSNFDPSLYRDEQTEVVSGSILTNAAPKPWHSLSGFFEMLETTSSVAGPVILQASHRTSERKLGSGAQFDVYTRLFAIAKAPFAVDEPFLDKRSSEHFFKGDRHYSAVALAVKRARFTLSLSETQPLDLRHENGMAIGVANPHQLHAIQLEIQALCHSEIRSCRNIVRLIAWGVDIDPDPTSSAVNPISPVLITERANCTLHDLLKGYGGSIPLKLRQNLCVDVSNALAMIHRAGVIHGDIKPANVLIFPVVNKEFPCVAKLSDFGLSVWEAQTKGEKTYATNFGTPGWRAPELFLGVAAKDLLKCDIFSMGLLLWSTMVGEPGPPRYSWSNPCDALQNAQMQLRNFAFPNLLRSCLVKVLSQLLPELPSARSGNLSETFSQLCHLDGLEVEMSWAKDQFLYRKAEHLKSVYVYEPQGVHFPSGMLWSTIIRYHTRDPNTRRDVATGERYIGWPTEPFSHLLSMGGGELVVDLAELYTSGICKVLPRARGELEAVVGPELSGHQLATLAMWPASSLSSHFADVTYSSEEHLPAEYYRKARAAVLSVAAAKGSLVAQALHGRLSGSLDHTDPVIFRYQWNAMASGFVWGWGSESQYKSARRYFRSIGGYNTHYVHEFGPTSASKTFTASGLYRNPLQWLEGFPLHQAAAIGNVERLESLLHGNYAPNDLDSRGETALHKACMAGNLEACLVLLEHGADPSLRSTVLGTIPLHWLFVFDEDDVNVAGDALIKENSSTLETTCKKDIPAFHFPFTWPESTPLAWATFADNEAAIRFLRAHSSRIDRAADGFFIKDPLNFQKALTARLLLKEKLLKNATECSHLLHYWLYKDVQSARSTLTRGHPDYASHLQKLVDFGLEVENKFEDRAAEYCGSIPLFQGIAMQDVELVKKALDDGDDPNATKPGPYRDYDRVTCPLGFALRDRGRVSDTITQLLLDQGAEVNAPSGCCQPLVIAAESGNIAQIRQIISYGADINIRCWYGETVLQAAIISHSTSMELLEYLLEIGASVTARGSMYETALHCAALRGRMDYVRLLVEHGADINAKGGHLWSVLQAAAASSALDVVEYLLKNGAEIDACGGQYGTALQASLSTLAYNHNPQTARILLDAGADVTLRGGDYGSALAAAAISGAKQYVPILLERGATVDAKCLENAIKCRSTKMLRMLLEGGFTEEERRGECKRLVQKISSYSADNEKMYCYIMSIIES